MRTLLLVSAVSGLYCHFGGCGWLCGLYGQTANHQRLSLRLPAVGEVEMKAPTAGAPRFAG